MKMSMMCSIFRRYPLLRPSRKSKAARRENKAQRHVGPTIGMEKTCKGKGKSKVVDKGKCYHCNMLAH